MLIFTLGDFPLPGGWAEAGARSFLNPLIKSNAGKISLWGEREGGKWREKLSFSLPCKKRNVKRDDDRVAKYANIMEIIIIRKGYVRGRNFLEISLTEELIYSADARKDGRRIDWITYRIKEREDRFSDQGDASSVSRLIHKHAYLRCSLVISWLDTLR